MPFRHHRRAFRAHINLDEHYVHLLDRIVPELKSFVKEMRVELKIHFLKVFNWK